LPESVFAGLGHTEYLSLADNSLPEVPHHILRQMPILKTLDISRCRLQAITDMDFQVSTKVIKGYFGTSDIFEGQRMYSVI
jgi:hypothetical protein